MMMHTRHSTNDGIEIPFHIDGLGPNGGWDRSRTWIVSRTGAGLRLKHDHRHADGTPHAVTLYGGDTADAGTAARQTFPRSEEHTSELQSLMRISYAVFCLQKKKELHRTTETNT